MSAYKDHVFDGSEYIVHQSGSFHSTAMNVPTGVVYILNMVERSFGGEDHMGHTRTVRNIVFIPGVFWDAEQDCFVKIGAK